MRNQAEIMKRFEESNDLFGTQKGDLISYMTFENAKPHLKEDYVAKVEVGEEKWEPSTDPKKEILEYLDFAYDKAEGQRGLSAGRSMLHFKTWIWLDDQKFYDEVISMIEGYTDYGIPALDRIAEHYSFKRSVSA